MDTPTVSELITKKELAKKLRITTRSIDNYSKSGIIKRIKIGANSRYNWLQVLESLETQAR